MSRRSLATLLLVVALAEGLGMTAFWALKGAHIGWTRTQVEVVTLDEVTGIEARVWEDRFVPGLELLGGSLLGAAAMAVVALMIRKTTNPQKS